MAGLFGYISQATIKNINITSGNVKSSKEAGGIVGNAIDNSKIIFCSNAAAVESAGTYAGGVVGYGGSLSTDLTIIACKNSGSVTLKTSSSKYNAKVGGIVGFGGIAIACRNSGSVSGTNNNVKDMCSGGISGFSGVDTACINTGSVFASSSGGSTYTGGIDAYNGEVNNCYWLENRGASYIVGNGTDVIGKNTEEQLKNDDRKSKIINEMMNLKRFEC